MPDPARLLLAYYGDDFTGSTDALESLSLAGLKTALFLETPTVSQLARHPGLQAFGVAGLTRSLGPLAIETVLRPAFTALRTLSPRHVHYKVCSTFDSSPEVGSIGRAIDVGAEVFGGRFVPLVVGAPALGRFCVFGNLFARMGVGSKGGIFRLDRHPSMSRHPVTPADESDLRLHLARQTARRIELFDILQLELPEIEARKALDAVLAGGAEIVLFDVLYSGQLASVGRLIDGCAVSGRPLLSVGSSGVGAALTAHWKCRGADGSEQPSIEDVPSHSMWPDPGPAEPLLVVSGSCSPVTAGQIDWALANGFMGIALAADGSNLSQATTEATSALRAGRPAVVNTSRGRTDTNVPAQKLGSALGRLALEAVEQTGLRRLLIAGGDTSSYAGRVLGIESLAMIAPLAPGAPLCRVVAPGSATDGLEINFKGGQVGASGYFGAVARGTL